MKQKLLLLTTVLFSLHFSLNAQVAPPCPSNTFPGAESCPNACVYCNFNGYTGINNGTPSGGNVQGCAITIHNDQWFGFVAGSSSITIDVLTSNCQTGDGLQAAFFDACNAPALDCNVGTAGGGGSPLTLTYSGFVPGQTYFLMIDGYSGDVCNFEIDVTNGSVTPPAPSQPAAPEGPTVVCPGAVVEYTIPPVDGAGYYKWSAPAGSHINGGSNIVNIPAPDGTTVTITFGSLGGQICVEAGNACFPPLKTCISVINQPIQPTILAPITVCFEDLPFIWDEEPNTPVSNPGTYNLTSIPYDSYLGCDSLVKQTIIVKQQITKNIGLKYICQGGCFTINGNNYCQPGSYQEKLESYEGCDSLVQFTILTVPVTADITPVTSAISCTSPTLTLTSNNSSTGSNVSYSWTNAAGTILGSGTSQSVNAAGDYFLIVSNSLGGVTCKDTATVTVPANIALPNISAQGGQLTCLPGGANVALQGNSTTSGVNYSWSGPGITPANQNQQNPVVAVAGTYTLTVTNPANNCTATATASVAPNNIPPTASAAGGTILCTQPTITIDGATNAASPTFNWAGPGINAGNQHIEDPVVTIPGNYTVTITNTANGCTSTATATVDANTAVPVAGAGNDLTINCIQSSVTLNGTGFPANVNFNWSGPGITPANQAQPTPTVGQAGTYVLTVTNPVNGCTMTDTTKVDASLTPPGVNAGADQTLTCIVTSVALGGAGTSQGANFLITWSGPGINPGNTNQTSPVVGVPGNYTITVTNSANGCTATDAVVIAENTQTPTADAGADQTLTCTTLNGVTLTGAGTPATVTYLWTGPGIGANNENLQTPQVSQAGVYNLLVTDPANGCTQTDAVTVVQDANVPAANAGPDLKLNCTVTSVNINASGSTSGQNILYAWTGPGITAANASVQSPTGISAPGTYNLTVIDTSNNCENTDIVVIAIDTIAPVANAGLDLVLNCYNNGADTLNGSASSTGANFTLLWNGPGITAGNQNSATPLVSTPGLYALTVTNTKNNCTATDQVNVADDQVDPTADAGADQIINCVTTSTSIGGGASSAGANFTYAWAGPGITPANQTIAQPTVNLAGAYQLVVTNTSNGCTAADDATVTLDAIYPMVNAGVDLVLTCANQSQVLDASGSSNGADFQIQWTGPDINAGNQNSLTPAIGQPGTYILSITNTTNSCVTQDTVLVKEDKTLPTVSAGVDQALDCQTTSVILDGSGSETGAGIQYTWSGAAITPVNAGDQSPAVDQPGLYTLLVTNTVNGCTDTDDVVVSQDINLPTANAGQDLTLTCKTKSSAIDGSGSSAGPLMEYLWQGPGINTSNYNLQNPVVADSGTYLLTVTNIQNHCTATDQVYVALDANLPGANAGADITLTCANDTLLLDGSASQSGLGITYAWSGPGISNGQTSTAPQVFLPGIYTLTVSNSGNGCTNTDAVSVGQDIVAPIANAGSNQILTCATSTGVTISANASDTGAGYTLQWSGPGITATNGTQVEPLVNAPGTYTLVVTNTTNGCTSSDMVTVGLDQDLPMADAGLDQTITCSVGQVTLDASGSTGNAPLDYTWSGPGITATNQNESSPTVGLSGIYTVTVTNSITGCKATDQVEVFLDTAPPLATATGGTITCTALDVVITASSSLTGSTFVWNGPGITLGNMNLQNPKVGNPGAYTVVVTAPNGCTASATATVGIDADVPLGNAEGTQLNCLNGGQSTIKGTVSTPGATFAWSGPNGFTSTVLNPAVTAPGTYVLTLQSPNGCAKPYQAEVTADFAQPAVVLSVKNKLDCSTTSVQINGNSSSSGAAFTYQWSTADGNIVSGGNTLSPVVDAPGQYNLLITNNLNGCTNTGVVTVEYDPSVPTGFDLAVKDIRCFGELNGAISVNAVLGGTQPFQFSLNGGPLSGTAQYSQLPEGTYTLQLLDAHGCKLDTTVVITAPGALQVDLEDDLLVDLGEAVTVIATLSGTTPIATIKWNPPAPCTVPDCLTYDTLPTHSYVQTITVTDSNGCVSTDRQLIQVDRKRRIYVPNAFNPNSNDPVNSFLMVQGGTDVRRVKTWQIFDRWGNAIFVENDFQPNDPNFAWNGKARGDDAAQAVYVWYIEVEFVDGQTEQFKGDVALVRK